MKYVRYYFISLVWWVQMLPTQAQDLKADLEQMNRYYSQAQDFKVRVQVEVFGATAQHVAGQTAHIHKQGNSFFYKTEQAQLLLTPQAMVMIQPKDKQVLYRPHSRKAYQATLQQTLIGSLDSVLRRYDKVNYQGLHQGAKHYQVLTSDQYITRTELFLEAYTLRLQRIIYYYNAKLTGQDYRVEVRFLHESADELEPNTFQLATYLSAQGKKAHLSPRFQHYHLTVLRDEK